MMGAASVNDIDNYILLYRDIHHIFNSKTFIIIFKASTLLIYLIIFRKNDELMQSYHNMMLQPLVNILIKYIFTCFT